MHLILVKHYEDSLKSVKKENFNLKLKIFFLEEKLSQGDEDSDISLIQSNTDLKVISSFTQFLFFYMGMFRFKLKT